MKAAMTMTRKIWSLPVVTIFIFAVGITINLTSTSASRSVLERIGNVDYPLLAHIHGLIEKLNATREGLANAVSATDKDSLGSAKRTAASFKSEIALIAAMPGKADLAQKLESEFNSYYQAAEEAAEIMLEIKVGDVTQAAQKMQPALETVTDSLRNANKSAEGDIRSSLTASQNSLQRGLMVEAITAALIIIVLILVSYLIIASVLRQLGGEPEYVKTIVEKIAGGDLSTAIDLSSNDRTSLLFAMQTMQQSLSAIVAEIRSAVETVNSAAAQMVQGNSQLSERTESQVSNLEETSASTEELLSTIKQTADNAKRADQLTESATAIAGKGGQAVGAVVETMAEISASSRKIADITGVIDGIAFQTNILALNAAVEAARAGDQGRGFAVVAAEVRNLAQRSATAAKEIKALINDSVGKVDAGAQQVQVAGSTMNDIVVSVRQVTEIMAEISHASSEQNMGVEQVNQAIMQLDNMTQQNAGLVEEASAAMESLQAQARQLTQSVSLFRLAGERNTPAQPIRPVAPANPISKQPPRKTITQSRATQDTPSHPSPDWAEF